MVDPAESSSLLRVVFEVLDCLTPQSLVNGSLAAAVSPSQNIDRFNYVAYEDRITIEEADDLSGSAPRYLGRSTIEVLSIVVLSLKVPLLGELQNYRRFALVLSARSTDRLVSGQDKREREDKNITTFPRGVDLLE